MDARLRSAWNALADPTAKVLSVDVFDTLVWRTVARPVDAFPLVGERLRDRGLIPQELAPATFGRIREQAERRARGHREDRFGDPEVTLLEIYSELPEWIVGKNANVVAALEVEIEVERELIVPDLEVVALLREAVSSGKTIIAVSDNYLGEQYLRELLAQPLMSELVFTHVFCSCDHRTGKGDGLFERVLSHLGVPPAAIVHIGDNEHADVECAERHGIRAIPFPQREEALDEIVSRERRIASAAPVRRFDDGGLTALRGKVAASGDAPLDPAVRDYWTWGATVLGPILSGFADWIAEWALRNEVVRIQCLMREGSLLSDLVNASGAYGDVTLYAEPLWLNRRVCLRAVIGDDAPGAVDVLCGRTPPTLRSLLAELGLDLQDVPALAGHADTRLEDPVLREVVKKQLDDVAIRTKVATASRQLADRIVRMIEQRVEPDDDRVVMVDLGWGASIQGLAERVLRQAGSRVRTTGLYLLTDHRAAEYMTEGAETYGFLAEAGMPEHLVKLFMRSPEILEQICTAAVGSQAGINAELHPELDEPGVAPLQQRQAREAREGARAFHAFAGRYRTVLPQKLSGMAGAADLLRPVLLRATVEPTDEEVLLFGSWDHDEGRGTTRRDSLVGQDEIRLASHGHPEQVKDVPMSRLYWPYGAVARAGEEQARLVGAAAAGLVPWEALSSPLENGAFTVEVKEGIDVDKAETRVWSGPRRNLRGRSLGIVSVRAPSIDTIEIAASYFPHVIRLDWLHLHLWEQGRDEPRRIVAADGDVPLLERRPGYLRIAHNVFAAGNHEGRFVIDVGSLSPNIVFRVDVECGFAFLSVPGTGPVPPEIIENRQLQAELDRRQAVLEGMQTSTSWRITAPLRRAKQLRARLGR